MSTQTITPKYVNEPKAGKTFGTVKLANDKRYWASREVIAQMQAGQSYEVEIVQRNWQSMGEVEIIDSVKGSAKQQAPAQNGHGAVPDRFQKQPTPKVDAERMFVAGALNSLLPAMYTTHQGLTPRQVEDVVLMLRQVWLNTFGADE